LIQPEGRTQRRPASDLIVEGVEAVAGFSLRFRSGCFRLERSPGGTCTHWESGAFYCVRPKRAFPFSDARPSTQRKRPAEGEGHLQPLRRRPRTPPFPQRRNTRSFCVNHISFGIDYDNTTCLVHLRKFDIDECAASSIAHALLLRKLVARPAASSRTRFAGDWWRDCLDFPLATSGRSRSRECEHRAWPVANLTRSADPGRRSSKGRSTAIVHVAQRNGRRAG
jgi:hypothetical protein